MSSQFNESFLKPTHDLQKEKANFQDLNTLRKLIKQDSIAIQEKINKIDEKNRLLKNKQITTQDKTVLENIKKLLKENEVEKTRLTTLKKCFDSFRLKAILDSLAPSKSCDIKSYTEIIKTTKELYNEILNQLEPPDPLMENVHNSFSALNSHTNSRLLENTLQQLKTIRQDQKMNIKTKLEKYFELINNLSEMNSTNYNSNLRNISLETIASIQDQIAQELSESTQRQLKSIHEDTTIDVSKKIEQYFELLNEINQIAKNNENYAIKKNSPEIIKSIQAKIASELNEFSKGLSLEDMILHNKKHHNDKLHFATSISNMLETKQEFFDESILSAKFKLAENLKSYQKIETHNEQFKDLIKKIANTPIAKTYQEKSGSSFFLKNMRDSRRKNDIEFLQKVIELLNNDQEMLPIKKISILLGALNHLDQQLQANQLTVGINKLKEVIQQKKDEILREIPANSDIQKVILRESQHTLKNFVQKNNEKFKIFPVAKTLSSLSLQPMMANHQKKQTTEKSFFSFNAKDKNKK